MEGYQQFFAIVGTIVGAIIFIKVFFTLWRIIEKKLHPEKFEKIYCAPEVLFSDLKKKKVEPAASCNQPFATATG